MSLKITPLNLHLGARVSGVNLSVPLSYAEFEDIHQAFVKHSVLVFPEQDLAPKDQLEFSRRFGKLMIHVIKDALMDDHPEIYKLSNLTEDGKPKGRAYAGQYWHSDLTYKAQPSIGSLLYGVQVPEYGGDTLFASTARAYDTLSPAIQDMLEGLSAEHHFAHAFRNDAGRGPRAGDPLHERPPVSHPVIRVHAVTGRKCLFVNEGFTVRINELSAAESDTILQFLFHHISRPQGVLRHHWNNGDAVMWDNRSTVHMGTND